MNKLRKWHSTRKEKPEADRIVIGYWISPDDDVMVGLCYLDKLGTGISPKTSQGLTLSTSNRSIGLKNR